jgi:hypothetical protein
MLTSYNGWPASPDPSAIGIVDLVVHGAGFPGGVKRGDVHTVLGYVAAQVHERVEALHAGWCWGYNYRQNRNADNLSCHASGTAIDINAPEHPNGKAGTFSAAQVRTIHAILAEVDHVVRWGGDYTTTKDEMHFEINASPSAVAMVAQRLARPAGVPAWWHRNLTYAKGAPLLGGQDVLVAQKWLVNQGFLAHYDSRGRSNVSGYYDAGTATAVDHLRTARGLTHSTTLDAATARLMA